MLEKSQLAPEFDAIDQNNQKVSLADFRDKQNVVLYFYPKDDTPGCTIEANQFTALAEDFARHDTVVIGVSKDNCDSHKAFVQKYNLNLVLLADTDGELCEKYGVWQEKEKNGEKKMGIVRSTFIIDKQGLIKNAMYSVAADGHAEDILKQIANL